MTDSKENLFSDRVDELISKLDHARQCHMESQKIGTVLTLLDAQDDLDNLLRGAKA